MTLLTTIQVKNTSSSEEQQGLNAEVNLQQL